MKCLVIQFRQQTPRAIRQRRFGPLHIGMLIMFHLLISSVPCFVDWFGMAIAHLYR
ncbi:hypothetical protein DFQ13_10313 [Actinokineospora spheciospongiae]|nr:hypothetical protein DFQ13_10313 [Actinokineospora spheciospongiae]